MGLKFSDFTRKGVDVSQYNGEIDWNVLASKCDYVSIRVGYGDTIDPKFIENIEAAIKTKLDIFVYFYSDYYSNWFNKPSPAYGLSDYDWGVRQANNCLRWIEPYKNRVKIVFIDIENVTITSFPKLTNSVAKTHSLNINKAFLETLDLKKIKNGIYASLGWLSWFSEWFKDRILWVAFYPFRSALVTISDLLYMVKKNGWKGPCLIWQYAQDGDQDDNGSSDGNLYFGLESKTSDLNGWVGTQLEYENIFGTMPIVLPEIPEIPEYEAGKYLITAIPYLFIRKSPSADPTSKKLGHYYPGTEVLISSVNGDWGRIIGQEQYIYLGYAEKIP